MNDPAVPARPVVRPVEQYRGEPFPLLDGISPTIGWQWLTEKKGGPVFAVLTRTMLGSHKISQRFPLTDEGWASAWRALVQLSPASARKVEAELDKRLLAQRLLDERFQPSAEVAALDEAALASLRAVTLLGGYASAATLRI